MIKRLSKLYKIGVFQNYIWNSDDTPDFSKFNAVYGWNGSGKTTISRVFSSLENGVPKGLEFEDDSSCTFLNESGDTSVLTKLSPIEPNKHIIVFNEDFINENLEWTNTKAKPILIVGKTKIDQKDELDRIRKEKEKLDQKNLEIAGKLVLLDKEKTKLLEKARAAVVTELTSIEDIRPLSGRATSYRTYTITDVSKLYEDKSQTFPILSDEEKLTLKNALAEKEEKEALNEYSVPFAWFDDFIAGADSIFSTTLTSKVVSSLEKEIVSEELREWFRTGHEFHRNLSEPRVCKFCQNKIEPARFADIEAYFDEQQRKLVQNIETALAFLEKKSLPIPPNSEKIYKEFEKDFIKARDNFFAEKQTFENKLEEAKLALISKKNHPFDKSQVDTTILRRLKNSLTDAIDALNRVISQHNEKTAQFKTRRETAAHRLESFLVGQYKTDFDEKVSSIKTQKTDEGLTKDRIKALEEKERQLSQDLKDHGVAAEEFNKLLKQFLGRSEISLYAEDEGYSITRKRKPAKNLSEGEKNAIALVFFLIKLEEDGFDSRQGIIVIDDPVSSFDSQHTYQAFGFIKNKIKEINPSQIFILSHNFAFFRLVRNWFRYENRAEEDSAKLYIVRCKSSEEHERFSVIEKLDPLLQRHNSEYSYLFKLVFNRAQTTEPPPLEKDYILPNVVRKLLENYLSMKVPLEGMDMHGKLLKLLDDYPEYKISAKSKNRLESYCQDNSHPQYQDSVLDFDERLLGELQPACVDLIELIVKTDPKHYQHLLSEVQSV